MRGAERAGLPTSSLLLALIGVLCVFGVVMVGSASEVVSIATYGSPWAILVREVMWMAIGLVVLVVTCRVDYRRWRRLAVPLLAVSLVLLLVVLVPGIGVTAGGSSRWIGFGQFRIQPSELAKLALAIFGADLVTRRERRGGDHRTIIGPLLLVAAAAGGLVLLQPDMGTALVLACMTLALLVASGVSMRPLVKVGGGLVVLAVIVGVIEPYRRARLLSFLDPTAHAKGSGYQVVQSLIGLGSGHVFGLGLGSSHEKWGLLPNAHTDFIYSVIGEELGFVGAICVLLALCAFAWFGLRAARALARPLRLAPLGDAGGVDRQRGVHQHRGGRRPAAGDRHPAPVHLLRRLLPRDHAGRGRHAGQRRPPRSPPRRRGGLGDRRGTARPGSRRRAPVSGRRYAVITGGGTASGAFMALAVAEALAARGHARSEITLIGACRGQEGVLLKDTGFPLELLSGRGIARRLDPRTLAANAAGPPRAPLGDAAGGRQPGARAPEGGRLGRRLRRARRPGSRPWRCGFPSSTSTWTPCRGRPAVSSAASPGPMRWRSPGRGCLARC